MGCTWHLVSVGVSPRLGVRARRSTAGKWNENTAGRWLFWENPLLRTEQAALSRQLRSDVGFPEFSWCPCVCVASIAAPQQFYAVAVKIRYESLLCMGAKCSEKPKHKTPFFKKYLVPQGRWVELSRSVPAETRLYVLLACRSFFDWKFPFERVQTEPKL